jgi:hypothetical protein
MEIRDAAAADVPAIWPFLHEIVAGDTFCARGERELHARATSACS